MYLLKSAKIFSILFFIFAIFSCEDVPSNFKREVYSGPISVVKDFDAKISDSGRIRYVIISDVMEELKSGDRRFPKGMLIETKNQKQQIESTLESDSAYFNKQKQLWTLRHNVVLQNIQTGERLQTDELYWDMTAPDSTNVYVKPSTYVEIKNGDQVFHGYGLRTSQDFEEYEILNLEGILEVSDEEQEK